LSAAGLGGLPLGGERPKPVQRLRALRGERLHQLEQTV
jgi:hypothetical protein